MPPEAGPVTGDRLEGWRVLVPRAAHQAGDLSGWLRRYGARPREVAMIAVRPPLDASPLDRALTRLREGAYAWVVFTSTNAVRAVVRQMTAQGLDPRLLRTVRVAAVGERTAAALLRLGVRADLVPDGEQSAEGLLRSWPPYDAAARARPVLLPRSDIARDTLDRGLRQRGWQCQAVTAYRTVPAAPPPARLIAEITRGGFDAVAFTSSSTVRNLLALTTPPPTTVIAAIGRQTAHTVREHGLRVHTVALRPSAHELAAALARYAAAHR
ncbi:uroporphyrinogen-III synthase [Actinomadura viridis]|uniref:uroporphyrinogen-III synthase n=1 Tax=Actinomadura viridis TaxID=58110 RepID=UPI0036BE66C7